MVDQFLAAAGKGVLLDEIPGCFLLDIVADDLDLARVANAQTHLVRFADEADVHRVKALQFGRHGIDGNLVGGGQQDILFVPAHGARAGAIAGKGAIHHRENARDGYPAGSSAGPPGYRG